MNIEIQETVYSLVIESATADNISLNEISSSSIDQIILNTDLIVSVSANDIIGLNTYLSNFIDSYEIDCGSP